MSALGRHIFLVVFNFLHGVPKNWYAKLVSLRQLVLLGVLNDEFVAGLTGLVAAHLAGLTGLAQLIYHDHILLSSCMLCLPLLCFSWYNF